MQSMQLLRRRAALEGAKMKTLDWLVVQWPEWKPTEQKQIEWGVEWK